MFQIVLFSVIAYLAACYGYGLFLLVRMIGHRRSAAGGSAVLGGGEAALPMPGVLRHPGSEDAPQRRAA